MTKMDIRYLSRLTHNQGAKHKSRLKGTVGNNYFFCSLNWRRIIPLCIIYIYTLFAIVYSKFVFLIRSKLVFLASSPLCIVSFKSTDSYFWFLFLYYRDDDFLFYENFVKTSTTNFLFVFRKYIKVYEIYTFNEFVIVKMYIKKKQIQIIHTNQINCHPTLKNFNS